MAVVVGGAAVLLARPMMLLFYGPALAKAAGHTLDDGTPAHSFATLLGELATIVRNTCRTPNAGPEAPTFDVVTTPNPKQQRALELLQQIQL